MWAVSFLEYSHSGPEREAVSERCDGQSDPTSRLPPRLQPGEGGLKLRAGEISEDKPAFELKALTLSE